MLDSKQADFFANGDGQAIQSQMKNEMQSVHSILNQIQIPRESLSSSSQQSFIRMETSIKESADIADRFIIYQRRLREAERKPGIREIIKLEADLNACSKTQDVMRINRELQHLKSIHSSKLSNLVQCQQGLLKERLELLKTWKNVLLLEMNILDDCKNIIKRRILDKTRELGDPDNEKIVKQIMENLSAADILIQDIKFDVAKVNVNNVHVLQEMFSEQMEFIRKVEMAVNEKRVAVETLSSIIHTLQGELPQEKVYVGKSVNGKSEIPMENASIKKSAISTRLASFDKFK